MRNPYTLFKTSAFAVALHPRFAPDGDARSSIKA